MGWNIILKLKQKLFNFDDEILKPFQIRKRFEMALSLLLKNCSDYKEVFDIDKYHEDVQTLKFWISKDSAVFMLIFSKKRK
jgi:hypothetical protein